MQDEKEIRSFYRKKDMFVQEFVPANTRKWISHAADRVCKTFFPALYKIFALLQTQ